MFKIQAPAIVEGIDAPACIAPLYNQTVQPGLITHRAAQGSAHPYHVESIVGNAFRVAQLAGKDTSVLQDIALTQKRFCSVKTTIEGNAIGKIGRASCRERV